MGPRGEGGVACSVFSIHTSDMSYMMRRKKGRNKKKKKQEIESRLHIPLEKGYVKDAAISRGAWDFSDRGGRIL